MTRAPLAILFVALTSSTFAQGLPALEGTGSQTQSLEALDGAASLSVDTGGSLSLGRGDDGAEGNLGVTVNGLTVELGNRPEETSPQVSPPAQLRQDPATTASGASAGQPQSGLVVKPLGNGETTDTCHITSATPQELAPALAHQFAVKLEASDCAGDAAGLAVLSREYPQLFSTLSVAGVEESRLISITIDDDGVIIAHVLRR